jgi:hypothetical protein
MKLVSAAGLAPGVGARPILSVPAEGFGCCTTRWIPVYLATHREFSGGGRISATLLAEAAGGLADPKGPAS